MFCEVDRSYVEDGFNLYGLRQHIPNITECLDVILDRVGKCFLADEFTLHRLIRHRHVRHMWQFARSIFKGHAVHMHSAKLLILCHWVLRL
jgi:Casein kinase II regulatory subunit